MPSRTEAGRLLAELLHDEYAGRDDVIVLAIPPGGVPVGYELEEAELALRGDRPTPDLAGRTATLVDDGVAAGPRLPLAIEALRQEWQEGELPETSPFGV